MPNVKRFANQYVSVSSAADHFGVSRMTVYVWLASGRLTGENIDGRTFVVKDELYDTAEPTSNRPTRGQKENGATHG